MDMPGAGGRHIAERLVEILGESRLAPRQGGISQAIAFRLETDGWQPGLFGVAVSYTGLAVPPHGGWPGVRVRIRGTRLVSVTRNP